MHMANQLLVTTMINSYHLSSQYNSQGELEPGLYKAMQQSSTTQLVLAQLMQQPPTPHATDTKTWHRAHQQLTKLNSVYATPQKLHQMPYRRYTPSYHDEQYTQANHCISQPEGPQQNCHSKLTPSLQSHTVTRHHTTNHQTSPHLMTPNQNTQQALPMAGALLDILPYCCTMPLNFCSFLLFYGTSSDTH